MEESKHTMEYVSNPYGQFRQKSVRNFPARISDTFSGRNFPDGIFPCDDDVRWKKFNSSSSRYLLSTFSFPALYPLGHDPLSDKPPESFSTYWLIAFSTYWKCKHSNKVATNNEPIISFAIIVIINYVSAHESCYKQTIFVHAISCYSHILCENVSPQLSDSNGCLKFLFR